MLFALGKCGLVLGVLLLKVFSILVEKILCGARCRLGFGQLSNCGVGALLGRQRLRCGFAGNVVCSLNVCV